MSPTCRKRSPPLLCDRDKKSQVDSAGLYVVVIVGYSCAVYIYIYINIYVQESTDGEWPRLYGFVVIAEQHLRSIQANVYSNSENGNQSRGKC